MTHNKLLQNEFSKQAARFEEKGLTLANPEYLQWMVGHLALQTNLKVLDVAAGTGHLSRAMAPGVERIVAVDATLEMLRQGRRAADQAGLKNITFARGFAEKLPFQDNAFDRVVCRFAVHHFQNPRIQMAEMVRVCRPNGRVVIIDLVSPDDPTLAESYNRLERLRDPSHTWAQTLIGLRGLLQEAGLTVSHWESRKIEVQVNRWLELTNPDQDVRELIIEELLGDVRGSGATGMDPFMRDMELLFHHTWAIVVGIKTGGTEV